MRVSMSVDYAIHGLIYLLEKPENDNILLEDIAEKSKVPVSYMRKIFQSLSNAGILKTRRGVKGGYSIAKSPKEINLLEIAKIFDDPIGAFNCNGEKRGCSLFNHCFIWEKFTELECMIANFLEDITLEKIFNHLPKNHISSLSEK